MARFAPKTTSQPNQIIDDNYTHGYNFGTQHYSHISKPGINKRVVSEISHIKTEPAWMTQNRLEALKIFQSRPIQAWGPDLSAIDFNAIYYYLKPTDNAAKSWDDVPRDVRETFDRLGIPEAERQVLAGVKAQYDSEVVYGSLNQDLADKGVVFLSMDEGLRQYPDLVKEYFGTIIPAGDNKFAALNTAAWSGGSFLYVPPGVEVKQPLQTYFRINAERAGQFERTLIIVGEGAKVHYLEGCFVAGTKVMTWNGLREIETIKTSDTVLTHRGRYQQVTHVQAREYKKSLYSFKIRGNPNQSITTTNEHPFLVVKREQKNQRNSTWTPEWLEANKISKNDYVCYPVDRATHDHQQIEYTVKVGTGTKWKNETIQVPSTPEFFALLGYYLAEGSISSEHYLHFSFGSHERNFIEETKALIKNVFGDVSISESHHHKNHGTDVIVSDTKICRIFQHFGTRSDLKHLPIWVLQETATKQSELIRTWFNGDGNYYKRLHKYGLKEVFRINTTSNVLAVQGSQVLARLGIASSLNVQSRANSGRKTMHVLVIGGQYLEKFGKMVGIAIKTHINNKKRATYYHLDENYLYAPVVSVTKHVARPTTVYNFGVEADESYTANGVAVHNCTAPAFSSGSLHSAVVEIFVKKGARCQYTTIQNWYKNVYNLVTKRAKVEAEAEMIWTDFNMGSKVTMKYPSFLLMGPGARGETLSMALAGAGQHQDTGSKALHLAPHTSSSIVSKSISKDGGRASYRGKVLVVPSATNSKNTVVCDALLLDNQSQTDTYPVDMIMNNQVEIQHEATVSKIGDDQLFYLMSRGVSEESARKMIVNGFIADLVRKLPLEYAVEMNRLIDFEMEGSVG